MPDGLSHIFEPVSARPNNFAVLRMGNLNEFLLLLQRGLWITAGSTQVLFVAFGDGAYNLVLPCISSYYCAFGGVPLTNDQDKCNQHLRSARITIEKNFGMVSNLFCICNLKEWNKLAKRSPRALKQLRVCHLLINCYVCCNGDQAGSTNTFGLMPPSLGVNLGTN